MKKTIIGVNLGALAFALPLLTATADTAERTASISIPASALVFNGDGLQAPDDEGHFIVGIKLPMANVKADRCEAPYLMIGLGDMNKPEEQLSSNDHKIVSHNREVYAGLIASAQRGTVVRLSFRNKPEYLSQQGGILHAPYCTLSLDDSQGRSHDN